MIVQGVDTSALSSQFDSAVPGRVLLLDGDGLCYRACAKVKNLSTAIRRFTTEVLSLMFLAQCNQVRIHLTAKDSQKAHRALLPTAKPYQANRSGKPKPPLLEPLRAAIAYHAGEGDGTFPEDWVVKLHHFWEADDALIMDAMHYGQRGLMLSDDKDLRLTPGPWFEQDTGRVDVLQDRFGWIKEAFTEGGQRKIKGHGTKFFWAQMLMGDTADNVAGLQRLEGKLCGPAAALQFLAQFETELETANAVLWAYAEAEQQPLPEAECLWLRRCEDDSAHRYMTELGIDANLRAWLDQQQVYCQRHIEEAFENEDEVST